MIRPGGGVARLNQKISGHFQMESGTEFGAVIAEYSWLVGIEIEGDVLTWFKG